MTLPIIFISGPTAIGKSELALKFAIKNNGAIINADSMQVYKELKILTARPTDEDQRILPHYLYGHVSAENRYNVSEWCNETISILKKNNKNKILSIIVGGTGLYLKTLLNGIANIPVIPEEYKQQSKKLMDDIGLNKFYHEVYKIDKISCEKISDNDIQRLKRIWEVYHSTGKTLSEWISNNHKLFIKDYDYRFYLFFPNRREVYNRVNNRFVAMINKGAINEVKNLLSLNLDPSLPIMKAHGVPEISQYLSGTINLEECIIKAQQTIRNYVKRQITWWKSSKVYNSTIFEHFPSNINLESLDLLKKIN